MKTALKNIFVITLPSLVVLALALEVFFRTIIPASEFPLVKYDPANDILFFESRTANHGTFTLGKRAEIRGKWRINNFGWNSPVDYDVHKTKPLIAVIGDSFVEAFQIDCDKSYPSLLRESLKDSMGVYSFGISGSQLAQYLQMYRYAAKMFDPDIVVVNVVHNDFDESIFNLRSDRSIYQTVAINGEEITERLPDPYVPSRVRRFLRHSALVRYLNQNLKIGLATPAARPNDNLYVANVNVRSVTENAEMIRKATSYILWKFREERGPRRIIFVMDAPRQDIYANRLEQSQVLFLNTMFRELCTEYGFELLDLTGSMSAAYAADGRKFENEIDAHWDAYGHRFVADQVLQLIRR